LTGAGRTGISDRGEAAEQDELTGANVPPGSPSPVVLSAAGTWPGGEPAAAAPVNAEAGLVEKEPRRGGKKSRKDGTGRHGTPRQCLCVLALGSCRPTGRRGVDLTAHSTARRRSAQVCGQDFGFGRVRSTCASRSPWTRIPTGPEARPRQCAGHRARTTDTEDLPRNPARESTAPLL
jgi:hypothetical protein